MFRILVAVGLGALLGGSAAAQTTDVDVKQKTTIEVKDGKDVTVTGCIVLQPGEPGFALTDVSDRDQSRGNYLLVGETDDVEDHVGHFVEIKGKVADRGNGRLKATTKTEVDRDDAKDTKTESETEVKGDLSGLPYLGVKSVKMIRPSCR